MLLRTGSQIGNITCDMLVVRRSDNKAIFAFVLDAFGLDANKLAKLNRQIVEMGNPVKQRAVRAGKGRMVVTGFRLCRHDGTLDRYLPSRTVRALPLAADDDLQLVHALLRQCASLHLRDASVCTHRETLVHLLHAQLVRLGVD